MLQTRPDEIRHRTYRLVSVTRDQSSAERWIDFFGLTISPDHRCHGRRVSPRALAISAHHRAVWELRFLPFDPETHETLIDRCPVCTKPLGWTRAQGIAKCDWCVDHRGFPAVDLRDFPQPVIDTGDDEALRFVTGLFSHDPSVRSAAAAKAGSPWSGLKLKELVDVVIGLAWAIAMDPAPESFGRPRTDTEYGRFTPEALSLAGRTVLGGRQGFAPLADRIRLDAVHREGFYGLDKELLPLVRMSLDPRLGQKPRSFLKALIRSDMHRTSERFVRRADNGTMRRLLPITTMSRETGLPVRRLHALAESGQVDCLTSPDADKSPILLAVDEIMPIAEQFKDALRAGWVANFLDIPADRLLDLSRRELLKPVSGPITGLLAKDEVFYHGADVRAFCAAIEEAVDRSPPDPGAKPIDDVVRAIGRPAPWGAAIAAILRRNAPVARLSKTLAHRWRRACGVTDETAFLRAVHAELVMVPHIAGRMLRTPAAADILGITSGFVGLLANAGHLKRDAKGRYDREEVEAFGRRYIFVNEISRRTGVLPRLVQQWLKEQGIEAAFQLSEGRHVGFARDTVPIRARE